MIKKKQIVSILILGLFISINFSASADVYSEQSFFQKNSNDPELKELGQLKLIRIPYSEENHNVLTMNNIEILGIKPDQWIDVIVSSNELGQLQKYDISYSVSIEDVDAHCNAVRGDYHSFSEMEDDLQDIANTYPNITSLYSIGKSYEDRDIWCLEITDNPGVDENEPGVFYMGLHHAREWPSLEICMYIAENLTLYYGIDSDITDVVNNRRLWLVPCVNPDGYHWDHDLGHDSRKNRHYFPEFDSYGVDLNRNYGGSCNGDPWGCWGSIGKGSVTHYPFSSTYCGPGSISENETQAIRNIFVQEDICASISWHTYSELVLWPWGYSETEITPDDTYLSSVGTQIGSLITKQSGSGTYTPQQSSDLYPTTGDTTDWAYGYGHYVQGRPTFAYTIEACSEFSPDSSYLDQICNENFEGALYLLQEAENISNVIPRVLPPVVDDITGSSGDYTVSWTQQNPAAQPDYYQLDELTNLTILLDDAESGATLWNLDGFSLSTDDAHSSSHSFKSRYANEDVSSMTTKYPLPVSIGMNLSFWCSYNIEENYDMAIVEVSRDGRCYDVLDTFTDTSGGWMYKEYSLDDYVNESIFLRFRHTTDSWTQEEGFYVDDVSPIPDFDTITTLSDSIADTYYDVSGNPSNIYYYRVRGYNAEHEWGDFSTLENVSVTKSLSADFNWTPVNPTTDEIIEFTDLSTDGEWNIVNWSWDFDDGNISYVQNPVHNYSQSATYSVCLTVKNENGTTDTCCKDIMVRIAGENIDVNQSIFNRGFPIRHAIDGDWAGAQNFTPTVDTITKVDVYLRKFGTPEFNLTVELREDGPEDTLIDTVVFTPSEVPSSWDWLKIDFADTMVTSSNDYFIVIPPAPSGVITSFGYEWGYAFGNQYADGAFWFTRDGGTLWRDLPTMYEFTFKTYGINYKYE